MLGTRCDGGGHARADHLTFSGCPTDSEPRGGDVVVLVCAVLYTIVWWNVSHSRTNWLVMFVVMIAVSLLAAVYAGRGILRAVKTFGRHGNQ